MSHVKCPGDDTAWLNRGYVIVQGYLAVLVLHRLAGTENVVAWQPLGAGLVGATF